MLARNGESRFAVPRGSINGRSPVEVLKREATQPSRATRTMADDFLVQRDYKGRIHKIQMSRFGDLMIARSGLVTVLLLCLWMPCAHGAEDVFETLVAPLLKRHCVECHRP